jgi:hypothetical protein
MLPQCNKHTPEVGAPVTQRSQLMETPDCPDNVTQF